MKLLLDTHTFIWFIEGSERLSPGALIEIQSKENERFVSSVSLWEIAIKYSLDKLEVKKSFDEILQLIIDNDIRIVSIETRHLKALLELEHHHKDPFDRLLIAQAFVENMAVLSIDRYFKYYPVNVIW